MPYKDSATRRQYNTRYKQRWRAKAAQVKNHPLKGFKVYLCPRFPSLSVGLACFDGGFLITNRPDVQAQVERHPEYGVRIFPLALDLDLIPTPTVDEDG